jgi:NAD(P)-dependent dehydrogenase (short-subunit alcohol dehydrogenase family)
VSRVTLSEAAMDYRQLGPPPGTRAVVVGGCGGIGREYTRGLLESGCRVAVLDRPSAIAVFPPPENALTIPVNATDDSSVGEAFAAAERAFSGLDLMAHLVGINSMPATIADIDLADFDRVLAVNLRSATLCCKLAIAIMRKSNGGTILLTSSGLATGPEPLFGAYSMSKAALIALTKTIAKEWAPTIRANAIAPGLVDTAFLARGTGSTEADSANPLREAPELRAKIVAAIPMGRIATPPDIAGPMLFLSGEASRYITGQVLYVNGGRLMP